MPHVLGPDYKQMVSAYHRAIRRTIEALADDSMTKKTLLQRADGVSIYLSTNLEETSQMIQNDNLLVFLLFRLYLYTKQIGMKSVKDCLTHLMEWQMTRITNAVSHPNRIFIGR